MSAENTSPLLSNKATESYDIYSDGDDQQKQLGFVKEFGYESKRLWKLAGPAIFTSISQYSLGALTQTFAGRVGELELAAFSVENSVIAGLAFGKFALWMLPQLFAYALNFPIQKFLQAQRKVLVMAWISAIVLVLHALFSWLLILKLGWGLIGAAITLNLSWWLIVILQLLYIFITKSDGAWSGFSWLAFADLWAFVKLSLASAVMLCLEFWYLMLLVVITGRLPNALIAVDAISVCMNIQGWDAMIAIGFNAAISVRVSNELGAGNARAAKFSVLVVSITAVTIGVCCTILVLATRYNFPFLFTNSEAVAAETTKLSILLAITVLMNCLQPVLSGVAVGAGWQSLVAYINLGCYYIVGLPLGILLGFTFGFGAEGIWSGMIGGIGLQTLILIVITSITNWRKEADEAASRVMKWGGSTGEHWSK
ncbi:protein DETOXIFICATION 33 [Citrus sinensis]|nr:protein DETOXIFICATION 33 [Citrus sinensis]